MSFEICNISKYYQKKIKALEEVNLTFESGIYGLLGPNGVGKSTLIQILTGNLRPTAGTVLYEGKEILKDAKKYKTVLGYVPQNQGLYDEFTAQRFLWYLAALKGMGRGCQTDSKSFTGGRAGRIQA